MTSEDAPKEKPFNLNPRIETEQNEYFTLSVTVKVHVRKLVYSDEPPDEWIEGLEVLVDGEELEQSNDYTRDPTYILKRTEMADLVVSLMERL